MRKYKIGIIGCGHIARKMADTLNRMEETICHAVASRDLAKAQAFAREWNFTKAYGAYDALADDPEIDLIYIATPHSHHYEHARMCLEKGKAVLCEKAFMANARQAEEILQLSEEKGVFITEAIWTRYMPLSLKIQELLQEGVIGTPYMLSANLSYVIHDKERIIRPELAGGALLDVGVYTLNFAAMAFGSEIEQTHTACLKHETGVDAQDSITLFYKGGKMATLQCGIYALSDRIGTISGDKGHLIIENINNPARVRVVDNHFQTVATFLAPEQITGFEYEVRASLEALDKGWIESPYMPHQETLRIMRQMDALRKEWGVVYPWD